MVKKSSNSKKRSLKEYLEYQKCANKVNNQILKGEYKTNSLEAVLTKTLIVLNTKLEIEMDKLKEFREENPVNHNKLELQYMYTLGLFESFTELDNNIILLNESCKQGNTK